MEFRADVCEAQNIRYNKAHIFFQGETMPPRLFISYRRADSQAMTDNIRGYLARSLGTDAAFQDVVDIPFGVDFRSYLEQAIGSCKVLLVIVGQRWLTITDETGNRRLDDPNDFTRIEVETGLKNPNILVVPVLVDGANMPSADELPSSLHDLHFHNAARVRYNPDFDRDMETLISNIDRFLEGTITHPKPPENRAERLLPAPRRSPMIWIGAAVVALVVIGIILAVLSNSQGAPSATPTRQAVAEATGEPTREPSATATHEPSPTEAPPSDTPRPTEAPATQAAVVPANLTPTVLYPEGQHLQLLYDNHSFYLLNLGTRRVRITAISFIALDAQGRRTEHRFDGTDWTELSNYDYVDRNSCVRIEIRSAPRVMNPSRCGGHYNATRNPAATDTLVFWTPQEDRTQFAVFWDDTEIARCEIAAGTCDVYVPA